MAEGATCWQPEVAMPARGLYFPPTLLSNVHPTSIVAQQEIFGPVLAAMTFRTPSEAVELANNTVYGLAACVWSESINVALQVAAQLKAGVVWVNCTNLFDASCGFGGYRESGYRTRGRKRRIAGVSGAGVVQERAELAGGESRSGRDIRKTTSDSANPPIDRTVKLYIGGKQARPDSGYSMEVRGARWPTCLAKRPRESQRHSQRGRGCAQGVGMGEEHGPQPRAGFVLHGGKSVAAPRRDCAPAVAGGWRSQAEAEVSTSIERIFSYAAWADKFDGAVHNPPFRNVDARDE